MKLLVNQALAEKLDDASFLRVLSFYPEENFAARKCIAQALHSGVIEFKDLKAEADKMLLPWQLFLLDPSTLTAELSRVESLRHKKAPALVAKRSGGGTVTSRRILDRLLTLRAYVSQNHTRKTNGYSGSLKAATSIQEAAAMLRHNFSLDMEIFRSKSKSAALAYFIERIEDGQINVCQGVLTNKILPNLADSRSVYKNTSGFVIRDDALPFIFLPSEINPDERDGRQILTLTYLLVLIGLDTYGYRIDRDFTVRMLTATGKEKLAYDIAGELLLPATETAPLRGTTITAGFRDELARRYKLTPTAVIAILRRRKVLSVADYDSLLPPHTSTPRRKGGAPVAIEASVRKFNGRHVFQAVNSDFSSKRLTAVQTQYLLFGSINKLSFKKYRRALGI